MFSAISGLRAHQNWMDVIGNNIANVNTTGFKVGRVRFQDILNQTVRGAGSPTAGHGGTNPVQVGLGVVVGAIDTIQTQGALQSTNRFLDMAIQGEGFFVMSDGNKTVYTRDGAFDLGIDGKLLNSSNGLYVMGWPANDVGQVDTSQAPTSLTIPLGQQIDATPTSSFNIMGNLNAAADPAVPADAEYKSDVKVVDSLGVTHKLTLKFTKTADNSWSYAYEVPAGMTDVTVGGGGSGTLTFKPTGELDVASSTFADLSLTFTGGADTMTITGGGDFSKMTQIASLSTGKAVGNGSEAGGLTSFSVSADGQVLGLYSNGTTKNLGQIAVATFANPGGLLKMGTNMFSSTANSGDANIGVADSGGRGSLANGYLEMSNVDLAEQFTNMIMAERGFQANSRVITTSDEVLQDLVNLKR
jgi:flagellar hook protein FlgE